MHDRMELMFPPHLTERAPCISFLCYIREQNDTVMQSALASGLMYCDTYYIYVLTW